MPEKFSKETRSRIMSRIRSKETKLEILFRKELYRQGIRGYRLYRKMLGNPDIAFIKRKIAIFIDGDFWHGHNWKVKGKVPPKVYWQAKIKGNMERDKRITLQLRKGGWQVIRLWEHDVKESLQKCINKVKKSLSRK